MARRLADRVTRTDPPHGLQLHHLEGKTEFVCIRCGTRCTAGRAGHRRRRLDPLVDRGCYQVWINRLGTDR